MASTIRLTRVIASSSRRWRHFCTEAASTTSILPIVKRGTRKSSRAGSDSNVSRSRRPSRSRPQDLLTQGLDSNELEQVQEFERQKDIFFQRVHSHEETKKFFHEQYDNMKRNETKFPGEVTKLLTGDFKGWRLYKPTLEAIPTSLPMEYSPEWQRIFMENREMWHKEGKFKIIFEGDVFKLSIYMESRCIRLTEATILEIPWRMDIDDS